MKINIIILAGGFGERLWPASSLSMPKQFMTLKDNFSFLQESIKRALAIEECGKIIIVTRKDIENECVNQCNVLANTLTNSKQRTKILNDIIILSEPVGKHTSAAIMSGLILLNKIYNQEKYLVLVLTSDHVIEPLNLFIDDCNCAFKAAKDKHFVCFSIPPTEPSVGYGYLKIGEDIYNDGRVYKIDAFKEKPDLSTAQSYYSSKDYFWNCGMFAFESNFFMNEMNKCTPNVYNAFKIMINGTNPLFTKLNNISVINYWPELEKTYESVPSIAVDKSIAEKTTHAVAVKTHFNWTDVGNWDTFSEICSNIANDKNIEINSSNNFIYSDIPVALCGVKDLVVVNKNGKLLIMKKGQSALVRDVAHKMKE